jgi:hypothetical protein
MAGLVPAIHVFEPPPSGKTWTPGTRPSMTRQLVSWEKPVRLSLIICGKPELGVVGIR